MSVAAWMVHEPAPSRYAKAPQRLWCSVHVGGTLGTRVYVFLIGGGVFDVDFFV
jgi:hypothetical protein